MTGLLHPCIFMEIGGGGGRSNDWARESREIPDGIFDILHQHVLMLEEVGGDLHVQVFLLDGSQTVTFWHKVEGVVNLDSPQESLK